MQRQNKIYITGSSAPYHRVCHITTGQGNHKPPSWPELTSEAFIFHSSCKTESTEFAMLWPATRYSLPANQCPLGYSSCSPFFLRLWLHLDGSLWSPRQTLGEWCRKMLFSLQNLEKPTMPTVAIFIWILANKFYKLYCGFVCTDQSGAFLKSCDKSITSGLWPHPPQN
jgi:hypothetical protein